MLHEPTDIISLFVSIFVSTFIPIAYTGGQRLWLQRLIGSASISTAALFIYYLASFFILDRPYNDEMLRFFSVMSIIFIALDFFAVHAKPLPEDLRRGLKESWPVSTKIVFAGAAFFALVGFALGLFAMPEFFSITAASLIICGIAPVVVGVDARTAPPKDGSSESPPAQG